MTGQHTPTPYVLMYDENYGYWIKPESSKHTLTSIFSDENSAANAAFLVKAANLYDELVATLTASKIEHYVCEGDPHFSCHATESSFDYYDDPQIKHKPEPICDCGADIHNKRIDDLIEKAKK